MTENKAICNGHETCLKDCEKKHPFDMPIIKNNELCWHSQHSDGKYNICYDVKCK